MVVVCCVYLVGVQIHASPHEGGHELFQFGRSAAPGELMGVKFCVVWSKHGGMLNQNRWRGNGV